MNGQNGIVVEFPEKYYLMTPEQIYQWRVERWKETGCVGPRPLTDNEKMTQTGYRMAEEIEKKFLEMMG